jgi:preprotein translocase subunit SecA
VASGEGTSPDLSLPAGVQTDSAYTHAPMKFLSRFVDSNDRELRRIQPWVDEANALEAEFESLSDEQIRTQFAEIRDEVRASAQAEEPSEDELTHEDLERRRELAKARRKR